MKQKRTARSSWEAFVPSVSDRLLADPAQRRSVQHVFFSGMLNAIAILYPHEAPAEAEELYAEIREILGLGDSG